MFDFLNITFSILGLLVASIKTFDIYRLGSAKKSRSVAIILHRYLLEILKDGNADKTVRALKLSQLRTTDEIQRAYEWVVNSDLSDRRAEAEHVSNSSRERNFDELVSLISSGSIAIKLLNAGLIRASINALLSSTSKSDSFNSSILGLMLGVRMKAYGRAYFWLFISLAIGVALQGFAITRSPIGLFISISVLCILFINQKVLEYRVNNGFFGNNASEAAEFIAFIECHADKSDFNDGEKMKRLFPEGGRSAQNLEVTVYEGGAAA